jgi:hypothetical protein
MSQGYPVPPANYEAEGGNAYQRGVQLKAITTAVRGLMQGRSNNVINVTLTENTTTTTVTDSRITFCSAILLQPTTANAAAALATTYISETGRLNGSVTITHANNAQTDRTFKAVIVG